MLATSAVNTSVPDELKKWREENLKNGLLSQEAVDAFSLILENSLPQVIVSTQDLQAAIHQSNNFLSLNSLTPKPENNSQVSATRHPRNIQENNYVTPRDSVEETSAYIWL